MASHQGKQKLQNLNVKFKFQFKEKLKNRLMPE
jgi:hypothetical protein